MVLTVGCSGCSSGVGWWWRGSRGSAHVVVVVDVVVVIDVVVVVVEIGVVGNGEVILRMDGQMMRVRLLMMRVRKRQGQQRMVR